MSSRPRKRSGSVDRPTGIGPAASAGLFCGPAMILAGPRRLEAALDEPAGPRRRPLLLRMRGGAQAGRAAPEAEPLGQAMEGGHCRSGLGREGARERQRQAGGGGVWTLATLEIDSIKGRARLDAPAAPAAGKSGPSWLDHLPGSKGRIYATGYSGPTYHAEDAKRYAGEDAIDNLAASLRAHVQAYTLLVESASGLTVDQFSRTVDDPDTAFRDLVRKNAKLEATWVDRDGSRPGDPLGAVWALASIDVQSTAGAAKPVEDQDLG